MITDFLLSYIGGSAGRLLVHLMMLSPEVHTWSNDIEEKLKSLPLGQHGEEKLSYILNDIFPVTLKGNYKDWKQSETSPWKLTCPKTKKFIRHEWMREGLEKILSHGASKIAFVNYSESLCFSLWATIEKNAECFVYHSTTGPAGPGNWYKADTTLDQIKIVKKQLHDSLIELDRWKSYTGTNGFYEINLHAMLFESDKTFLTEYRALCNFYEITNQDALATKLREQWLGLHQIGTNFGSVYSVISSPQCKFYDIAYAAFVVEEMYDIKLNDSQLTQESLQSIIKRV